MLGACIGFFGPPAHAELHSHIAGVRPAGLGRSVGFALKVHQRAWCLRRDVRVIAWTYDPLIRRNAYFNLVKLGARPAEYLRNFYGVMDDVDQRRDRNRPDARALGPAFRPRGGGVRGAVAGGVVRGGAGRGAVVALSAGPDGAPLAGGARGRPTRVALDGLALTARVRCLSACPPTSRRCGCRIPRSPAPGGPRCATCCPRCSAAAGG